MGWRTNSQGEVALPGVPQRGSRNSEKKPLARNPALLVLLSDATCEASEPAFLYSVRLLYDMAGR